MATTKFRVTFELHVDDSSDVATDNVEAFVEHAIEEKIDDLGDKDPLFHADNIEYRRVRAEKIGTVA